MESLAGKKVAVALFGLCCAGAQALQISIAKPGEGARFLDMDNYTVQLSGDIEPGDSARLEARLKPLLVDGRIFSFYLDSPGGSLLEGMKLGRVIRQHGLTTYIGRYRGEAEKSLPGKCLSACALTFLGGKYRFVDEKSRYGVHRFYTDRARTDDLDAAQIISAAIANYIREMGVDQALLDSMTAAGREDMNVLSAKELKELNVANGGRLPSKWTIEVVEGSTYLRGEQTTIWGLGRAMFVCGTAGVAMQSLPPVGDKGPAMLRERWVHSLLVDGQVVPIAQPMAKPMDDGYLYSLMSLSKDQVEMIARAKSVGHAIQPSADDPRYVGYTIDIGKSDQARVGTYLMNCVADKGLGRANR